jgi:hypothetical protein
MLERQELAGVVFGTGLTLVLVGVVGIGGGEALNYALSGTGVGLAVLATSWWGMLRRRGL